MDKTISVVNNYKLFIVDNGFVLPICQELGIAENEFSSKIKEYKGKYKDKIRTKEYHNLVPLGIRTSLAYLISGTSVAPTFKANYVALGDSVTPPTINDTILGNEVKRGIFSNRYAIDNVAYLDKYFGSTEVGGNTYLEIGIFVDGTAGVNTGYLLSKVAIDEQLAINESLTINATITIL